MRANGASGEARQLGHSFPVSGKRRKPDLQLCADGGDDHLRERQRTTRRAVSGSIDMRPSRAALIPAACRQSGARRSPVKCGAGGSSADLHVVETSFPGQRLLDNLFQIVMQRNPAEFPPDAIVARDEGRGIACPAAGDAHREIDAGYLLHDVDHFQNRKALRIARIADQAGAAGPQMAQCVEMGARKIRDVNVVAHARAVRRRIIDAVNVHAVAATERRLYSNLYEMRRASTVPNAPGIGAGDVEVAQRHIGPAWPFAVSSSIHSTISFERPYGEMGFRRSSSVTGLRLISVHGRRRRENEMLHAAVDGALLQQRAALAVLFS